MRRPSGTCGVYETFNRSPPNENITSLLLVKQHPVLLPEQLVGQR